MRVWPKTKLEPAGNVRLPWSDRSNVSSFFSPSCEYIGEGPRIMHQDFRMGPRGLRPSSTPTTFDLYKCDDFSPYTGGFLLWIDLFICPRFSAQKTKIGRITKDEIEETCTQCEFGSYVSCISPDYFHQEPREPPNHFHVYLSCNSSDLPRTYRVFDFIEWLPGVPE